MCGRPLLAHSNPARFFIFFEYFWLIFAYNIILLFGLTNDHTTQLAKERVRERKDLGSNPRSNIFHFLNIPYKIQHSTWPEVYHGPPIWAIRSPLDPDLAPPIYRPPCTPSAWTHRILDKGCGFWVIGSSVLRSTLPVYYLTPSPFICFNFFYFFYICFHLFN